MFVAQRNNAQIQGRVGFSLFNLDHGHSPFAVGVEFFSPLPLSLTNIHWLIKVRHIVSTRLMQLSYFLFFYYSVFILTQLLFNAWHWLSLFCSLHGDRGALDFHVT